MPQINRIRVNNVKYNFGTQFYDDFVMRFSCKNTIYDLANGGGKSVLMLLLLQNLIPNCTLDEKQPVEKLFRTGSGSSVIHSLVEWKLDREHIKNNYKYMLTGFCARRAKDEEISESGENASIDYFNYCIFYREFNDNDLKNLPLSNGRERVTYSGLKNYLRELEKKDYSLEVKIFDRKGEYQRFIAGYGLYESQWEIIRGINRTEGHVRTYFENNYKTTRKVVEDLLIEEIIEKSFNSRALTSGDGRDDESNAMAKTLLDIKDKLIELSKRKEDIDSYDRQIEAIESFYGRISGIRQLYFGREAMEEQIIKTHNSLNIIMAKREAALSEYEGNIEELIKEKAQLEHMIDTVRVQITEAAMKKLGNDIDEISDKLEGMRKEWEENEKTLLVMESENDYLDYIYYKGEGDSVRALMEALTGENREHGELKCKLAAAAYERKVRDEKKKQALNEQIKEEEEKCLAEQRIGEELKAKENSCLQKLSVAEYMSVDGERRLKELDEKIYRDREQLGMTFAASTVQELGKMREELSKQEAYVKETGPRSLSRALEKQRAEYSRSEILQNIEKLEAEQEALSKMRDTDKKTEEKYGQLCGLYGENTMEGIIAHVNERYGEVLSEVSENREIIEDLKSYAENLRRGCPVGETEEIKNILSYIEKYHGDAAVSGSSYIGELEPDGRRELLERIPILPYSIILKTGYNKIIADKGMEGILKSDYAVPLVRWELVTGDGFCPDMSGISFVMRQDSLFTDGEAMERELEKTEEEIRDREERQEKNQELMTVLKNDIEFLKEYKTVYRDEIIENERKYVNNKLEYKKLQSDLDAAKEKEYELARYAEEMKEKEEESIKSVETLREKIKMLEHIAEMETESSALAAGIKQAKIQGEAAGKEYSRISDERTSLENRKNLRKEQTAALKKEVETIDEVWNRLYKEYYREETDTQPYGFELKTDMEIDAESKAMDKLLKGAAKDLDDKRKLLENYDTAMEKSLLAIDYKGVPVDKIEERYKAGSIHKHSREELKSFRALSDGMRESVKTLEGQLRKSRTEKDKLEGAAENGIQMIEEKYGEFVRTQVDENEYEGFVKEKKQRISGIGKIIGDVREKIENMQACGKDFIIYRRDLDKIIESLKIKISDTDGLWDEDVDISGKIKEVSDRFGKYCRDVSDRREEMEHEKNVLSDTLRALSSFRLADEIRENVVMPESVEQTEELMDSLKEITDCLRLEKEQVEKSIRDMEMIKDHFENQCIQSCVNIRTELDKLPKLSKINMDGEQISIIDLSIPYINENAYKEQMSEYIDDIVAAADTMRTEEERIKFIRGRLSWKKLFSVIVRDMNGIKLTLYKRERIKEQSRYLRYEEAVGSTGQSQGIYIQFLIGIINYITSINSGNAKSSELGKTIFIDNPFGAAKDVYIWEPIFKMLKTNNVQLIVPCRGATPAITSRFDVNYLLGQKMTDGKQQTVVVEYYSNVESDALEYEKLSFEQNELTFL